MIGLGGDSCAPHIGTIFPEILDSKVSGLNKGLIRDKLSRTQIMFSDIDTKVSAVLPRCRKLENKEENAQNLFFEMTSRYEILMETENLIER